MKSTWKNQLYFGDNLTILREHVPDESVDLVYLDPPFNSQATYNVLFGEKNGTESQAQITAFEDTWHWGPEAEATYHDIVTSQEGPQKLAGLIQALRGFLGRNDMMAYLVMMSVRLSELHRVLKPTGSIYLHCDPTASHYLRLLMDAVFDPRNFKNELIWKRTNAHSGSKRYGPVHDTILFYSRSGDYRWIPVLQGYDPEYVKSKYRQEDERGKFQLVSLTAAGLRGTSSKPWRGHDPAKLGRHWAIPGKVIYSLDLGQDASNMTSQEKLDVLDRHGFIYWPAKSRTSKGGFPRYRHYLDKGTAAQDIILDVWPINSQARERLGYPTQKPEALLERIIRASSNEGDLVLDPFCGCGTTIAVAERLNRRWIGIDITHLAKLLMSNRLKDTFGSELSPYEVIGDPKDLASAKALAEHSRFQFEWWALTLVNARPAQDKKKGADAGIDGYIYFFDDESGKAKKIILQVKSGKVSVRDIRDLKGVVGREDATIGAFLTLNEPTRPMKEEAIAAGYYDPEYLSQEHRAPKVQILTIQQLLNGAEIKYPRQAIATHKKASRKHKDSPTQQDLYKNSN